jgi:hypothetical protein
LRRVVLWIYCRRPVDNVTRLRRKTYLAILLDRQINAVGAKERVQDDAQEKTENQTE